MRGVAFTSCANIFSDYDAQTPLITAFQDDAPWPQLAAE